MDILIVNAKNSEMKILKQYNERYAWWYYLKRWYESQSDACKAYLVDKSFALRKTDATTKNVRVTKFKNIMNLLEGFNIVFPDEFIMYYAFKNLSRDYEFGCRRLMKNVHLPVVHQRMSRGSYLGKLHVLERRLLHV